MATAMFLFGLVCSLGFMGYDYYLARNEVKYFLVVLMWMVSWLCAAVPIFFMDKELRFVGWILMYLRFVVGLVYVGVLAGVARYSPYVLIHCILAGVSLAVFIPVTAFHVYRCRNPVPKENPISPEAREAAFGAWLHSNDS